eukprot:3090213-Pyramimonas_sp.AAC.1
MTEPIDVSSFSTGSFCPTSETCMGQAWLEKTTAHVALLQEHKQFEFQIPSNSSWATRNGWKSLWTAATTGPGGGPSGGAAILVRS